MNSGVEFNVGTVAAGLFASCDLDSREDRHDKVSGWRVSTSSRCVCQGGVNLKV